ncbi:hypothetical protein [Dehalococcoides mccartyi]|uniref:hypothetical protein n=1 Tax=Dehalococcoides mccartyi TaxID=61435 RepID=UPI0008048BB8|nr:hypothetical protein [Dehalococcoides mccartyi]OBW61998.1 MAG: hypothetical protein A9181_03245 [Dehalococcoides mccartyi]
MAFADSGVRTIVNSGKGSTPPKITLAGACKVGDVLGYSSGWKPALATAGSVIQGRLVALRDGAVGDEIPVSPCPVVDGYTGGTPGNPVYVAEGANSGCITETIPDTASDATTQVGMMLSATQCQFNVGGRADSVVSG